VGIERQEEQKGREVGIERQEGLKQVGISCFEVVLRDRRSGRRMFFLLRGGRGVREGV
jgi:hypothetical protein